MKELLSRELVETNVDVTSWQDAANKAGMILVEKGKVKEEFIESMIEVVNKYGPYMILVPEVCLFHGEPGSNIIEPCLSLVTFKETVYFKEFENQPINCAFAFGATDKDSHMGMIVKLTKYLQNEEFIEAITTNADKEVVMKIIKKIEEE